jgi:hypothetical protein
VAQITYAPVPYHRSVTSVGRNTNLFTLRFKFIRAWVLYIMSITIYLTCSKLLVNRIRNHGFKIKNFKQTKALLCRCASSRIDSSPYTFRFHVHARVRTCVYLSFYCLKTNLNVWKYKIYFSWKITDCICL